MRALSALVRVVSVHALWRAAFPPCWPSHVPALPKYLESWSRFQILYLLCLGSRAVRIEDLLEVYGWPPLLRLGLRFGLKLTAKS